VISYAFLNFAFVSPAFGDNRVEAGFAALPAGFDLLALVCAVLQVHGPRLACCKGFWSDYAGLTLTEAEACFFLWKLSSTFCFLFS
jgi:hypothetical protein